MEVKTNKINLPNKIVQEQHNKEILSLLLNHGLDFYTMTKAQQHKALTKAQSICKKCDIVRKGYVPPKYIEKPDIVFIGRSITSKYITSSSLLPQTHPSYSIVKDMCDVLGFNVAKAYYTNIALCATKSVNDINTQTCSKCMLHKDLEMDTIELPTIFILLGNDAMNTFFNLDVSVNNQIGNIYYSEYKGNRRLFIPVPHPVYLLRDNSMYQEIIKFLSFIKGLLDKGLIERLEDKIVSNR